MTVYVFECLCGDPAIWIPMTQIEACYTEAEAVAKLKRLIAFRRKPGYLNWRYARYIRQAWAQ